MLYFLYSELGINFFRYITARAGISFFLAFFLCIFLLPRFIAWAKKHNASQPISEYVPAHKQKGNTPTMGGIVFVFSAIIAALFSARFSNVFVALGVLVLFGFALIGARDDYVKIAAKNNAGMRPRVKMFFLLILSLFVAFYLSYITHLDSGLYLPFMKHPLLNLSQMPWLTTAFWVLVFLATTNAVNITDGLDGLATVPSICALFSLSIFVYITGNFELANYLLWPRVTYAGELFVVSMALIGALFGFLWYNCHPAQIFMGDSGSLALGGFIAYMAIVSNNEILLILIGSVFVIETFSVILQIGSYKMRNKKIFLMAPIHHHFEKKGWAENKIIVRFWIIAILSNIIALMSLKIR
ncbi:phospho-N-acetylmuramoyl-pentapeptide-transferase [Helicobacter mustelae]|uniref:Phospho-N-acetylmuramoyl-pentapeptide-transferase n=1 Tax=Helicobacter mustelae (strain ATCC 43772 / CCUG 25715 / CIP 103759 / LMG 18044 / NCTC 12198 / R85-136P) TaxID=679897 RepID=D3UG07_HELM1|nr:phospho-N-acetylmuramoyl-pentapeptide-transferase [Helicobacter mustelae]CBG39428.1 phospho-N-acetylmuramoyl-pentapeptide-transfera se [Helicobacter mustelae 12198]SQH70940.1 phospho-N-acetylmuramoyl-pentapeptide-transfera se [Helicobacter mustelae]